MADDIGQGVGEAYDLLRTNPGGPLAILSLGLNNEMAVQKTTVNAAVVLHAQALSEDPIHFNQSIEDAFDVLYQNNHAMLTNAPTATLFMASSAFATLTEHIYGYKANQRPQRSSPRRMLATSSSAVRARASLKARVNKQPRVVKKEKMDEEVEKEDAEWEEEQGNKKIKGRKSKGTMKARLSRVKKEPAYEAMEETHFMDDRDEEEPKELNAVEEGEEAMEEEPKEMEAVDEGEEAIEDVTKEMEAVDEGEEAIEEVPKELEENEAMYEEDEAMDEVPKELEEKEAMDEEDQALEEVLNEMEAVEEEKDQPIEGETPAAVDEQEERAHQEEEKMDEADNEEDTANEDSLLPNEPAAVEDGEDEESEHEEVTGGDEGIFNESVRSAPSDIIHQEDGEEEEDEQEEGGEFVPEMIGEEVVDHGNHNEEATDSDGDDDLQIIAEQIAPPRPHIRVQLPSRMPRPMSHGNYDVPTYSPAPPVRRVLFK